MQKNALCSELKFQTHKQLQTLTMIKQKAKELFPKTFAPSASSGCSSILNLQWCGGGAPPKEFHPVKDEGEANVTLGGANF